MTDKDKQASTHNAEQATREKQVNQSIHEDQLRKADSTAVKPSEASKPDKK